jgi:hypothetical protein
VKRWPKWARDLPRVVVGSRDSSTYPATIDGVELQPGERCGFVWVFRTWRLAIPPTREPFEGLSDEEIADAVRYVLVDPDEGRETTS